MVDICSSTPCVPVCGPLRRTLPLLFCIWEKDWARRRFVPAGRATLGANTRLPPTAFARRPTTAAPARHLRAPLPVCRLPATRHAPLPCLCALPLPRYLPATKHARSDLLVLRMSCLQFDVPAFMPGLLFPRLRRATLPFPYTASHAVRARGFVRMATHYSAQRFTLPSAPATCSSTRHARASVARCSVCFVPRCAAGTRATLHHSYQSPTCQPAAFLAAFIPPVALFAPLLPHAAGVPHIPPTAPASTWRPCNLQPVACPCTPTPHCRWPPEPTFLHACAALRGRVQLPHALQPAATPNVQLLGWFCRASRRWCKLRSSGSCHPPPSQLTHACLPAPPRGYPRDAPLPTRRTCLPVQTPAAPLANLPPPSLSLKPPYYPSDYRPSRLFCQGHVRRVRASSV